MRDEIAIEKKLSDGENKNKPSPNKVKTTTNITDHLLTEKIDCVQESAFNAEVKVFL